MSVARDWALVTGAGSGIGAALVGVLAARGLGVALVGRRGARLEAVAEGITAPTLCLPADVASGEDRMRLEAVLADKFARDGGTLRHVVHAAGIGDPSPDFARTDPEALVQAFAVNVVAPMALTQALLPMLRKAGSGRVVMLGAGIADRAQPGTGIYGITKKALARLVDQMAADVDHEGDPRAPAVALFQPGLTDTEGLRAHLAAAQAAGLPHADWMAGELSAGRARSAGTVATAIACALLDLDHAAFHGQTLRPDALN